MAQTNRARRQQAAARTHEGGRAQKGNYAQQLRRAVTSCLLWEDSFYESGESIAERIQELANKCDPEFVIGLAISVRQEHGIRHAPLWLILSILPRKDIDGSAKASAITNLISRADEIPELLSMYWELNGKDAPVAAALKRGLAGAFEKFDEYQFAKYKGIGKSVTLRDAMFICHPKPGKGRKKLYKRLANDKLQTPDTWEVGLSTGGDKKETFTRLLEENRLGYLAALRNIRNMVEAGVSKKLIRDRLLNKAGRKGVLPFQFISASLVVPGFEDVLDRAMVETLEDMETFPGSTAILVDTSGSMASPVSGRSMLQRVDAASGMAIMLRELCDDVGIYAWSETCKAVAPRRGMALRDAIRNTNVGWSTYGDRAVQHALRDQTWDRVIMVTDMQLHDGLQAYSQVKHKYVVNVASYQNGVGYGNWNWIEGFSAQTIRYMRELEKVERSDLHSG